MPEKTLAELRILVVDDDPFILRAVGRILENCAIKQVICTDKPEDALKLLSSRIDPIDILISDLNMPELDGIQLIRHLGDLHQNVALILMSGEDKRILKTAENIALERKINVLGTIEKPVSPGKLVPLLQSPDLNKAKARSFNISGLDDDLREAIHNNSLMVYYQPQVSTVTGKIVGAEALARWKHSEKGMIPPTIFIPLAEQLGIIDTLTMQIYNQVFDDMVRWQQLNFGITASINFSPVGLCDLQLPEVIQQALKVRNVSTRMVIIEVTESSLTRDSAIGLDILTRFRLKGFGLSIDDFGTGFSTLEQLNRIPFTELKIDRSFVHGAVNNRVSRAILESSLALARRLEIQTVVEGVENSEDLALVTQLGSDIVQGYYYAKPMPMNDFCEMVTTHNVQHGQQIECID